MLHEVEQLASRDLLARVRELTRLDNRTTARLVAHLSEIDARKLYADEGFTSASMYCIQVLHYSEATAYRRIEAGRAVRRFPIILERIADGSIHLTGITLLAPHLTAENHLALLEAARHRTRRQIERLLAAMNPERSACPRTTIVPLPRRAADRVGSPASMSGGRRSPDRAGGPGTLALFGTDVAGNDSGRASAGDSAGGPAMSNGPAALSRPGPDPGPGSDRQATVNGSIVPDGPDPTSSAALPGSNAGAVSLAPDVPESPTSAEGGRGIDEELGQYRLHVTITEGTRARLERAQSLMSHINPSGDVAVILDRALATLIGALERRKFGRRVSDTHGSGGASRRPRGGKSTASASPRQLAGTSEAHPPAAPAGTTATTRRRPPSRHIPSSVRQAVWHRDRGRCAFVSRAGHRCEATDRLEFHHIVPWSHRGASSTANLTLRCRTHNAYEAETTMGRPTRRTRTGASSGRRRASRRRSSRAPLNE